MLERGVRFVGLIVVIELLVRLRCFRKCYFEVGRIFRVRRFLVLLVWVW